ncbi:SpoIIE family protein phosphatase [Streptomyces sp. NPDC001068]|uniref:ATP-binding SpoIIE family protein phosphatase n=1 Tax=Streptomyces sp. NPDC001068 TaxID=3364544 RepID=UPI0036A57064
MPDGEMPADDVLLLLDEEGRVVRWGGAAEKMFGCSAAQALGRPVGALLHQAALGGPPQRHVLPDPAGLTVRPALDGDDVVWQVRRADADRTTNGAAAPDTRTAGVRAAAREGPAQVDTALLSGLLTYCAARLQVFDPDLRLMRMGGSVGPADGPRSGFPRGTPFSEACGFAAWEEEAALARTVVDSGVPLVDRLVRGAVEPGGHGHPIRRVSYFRLQDPDGAVLGLVVCAADVTAQERARRSVDLLQRVRTGMGHRLNVMDACQELVDAVVPAFADAAVVDLAESTVRGGDALTAPVSPGVLLCRAAAGGPSAPAHSATVHPLATGTAEARVLADLQPRVVASVGTGGWLVGEPSCPCDVEEDTARSVLVAPLALGHQVLGIVRFCRHAHGDAYEQDDLALASAVCAHAALCIDRASLYMREWIVMSTVQRRLLPGNLEDQPTLQVCPLHITGAEGGGGWCDAIALPGARTALVAGSVAGQGIPAAIAMGLLRTAIHTLVGLDLQPDELLARLSDTAARLIAARAALPPLDPLAREPLTAGCVVAIYDPVELTCTIARAGLPEPVAVLPDGTSPTLAVPAGPALAAPDTAPFPATTVSLPVGSTLALGTAELAEQVLAPSGPLRLLLDSAATEPLGDVCGEIARAYARDHTDDTLLLLARTKAVPPGRVLTCPLPEGPEAAAIARRSTRDRLAAWGLDEETSYATELIVSELVGNATRYGAPPIRLRIILDRMLTCEVRDGAPSAPQVRHARTVDESGRGLFIVASLAEQWGTRYTADGKIVWAEQPAGTAAASA